MTELGWTSVADLARLIGTKQVSPVEVVRACLDRITALDGTLRTFITVCAEPALQAAHAALARVLAGETLGPLDGVPIGLKDLFDTAGVRTTAGSRILADRVPGTDATVVTRLTGAGAIVLGKLNMHEFAYGPLGRNAHYGDTVNPWDAGRPRVPGGSSSGSGAAVAAGLVPAALGSDTGGSIRMPASLCGVTGLKPTYGRVSRAGVLPLAWTMDHVGPMARTAEDCALLLGAMAGYDPGDASTSVLPVPDYARALSGSIAGVRVGVLRQGFLDASAADVAAGVEAAARMLQSLGAKTDDAAIEQMEHVPAAAFAIVASEALAYHAGWLKSRPADYQPDVRERLQAAAFVTGAQYVRAQQTRALIRDAVDEALRHRDLLLAPATPITAPALDETHADIRGERVSVTAAMIRLTRPFNLSGHPVCAVPCGFTAEGLPIGMQIIGRPFDEVTVLRVADAYQRATDWHRRRPPLAS